MNELNKLEERIKNRRLRRWKRRGRILAPFAALPILLATLILSVDFIEYRPEEPRTKLADRPLPKLSKPAEKRLDFDAPISASVVSVDDVFKQARTEIPAIDGFEEGDDLPTTRQIPIAVPAPRISTRR